MAIPQEVIRACRTLEQDLGCEHEKIHEESLLSFRVYEDRVVLVVVTGQKYEVGLDDLVKLPVSKRKSSRSDKSENTLKK